MPKYEQPKEGVARTQENGGAPAPAGKWRHPGSGEEAITLDDPLFGNAMSQGFARLGFDYVGPPEEGDIKTMPEMAIEAGNTNDGAMKGVQARLNQLEGVVDENKSLKAENEALRASQVAQAKADEAASERDKEATAKAEAEAAKAHNAAEQKSKDKEEGKK